MPVEAEWKADHFQLTDEFRAMIVKNMSSDPKLGIIYREIVKVAKANLCVKAKPSWS